MRLIWAMLMLRVRVCLVAAAYNFEGLKGSVMSQGTSLLGSPQVPLKRALHGSLFFVKRIRLMRA